MKQLLKKFFSKKTELPKLPPGETELDYVPVHELNPKIEKKKLIKKLNETNRN